MLLILFNHQTELSILHSELVLELKLVQFWSVLVHPINYSLFLSVRIRDIVFSDPWSSELQDPELRNPEF